MAITEPQRRLLDRYLSNRTGEELEQPTTTITVTKRQLAYLIEAIDHFQATRCPVAGRGSGCELLSWYENPSTGAVAVDCFESCTAWLDSLIEQVVPTAFERQPQPVATRS